MTNKHNNDSVEESIDRLDDRYLTKKSALTFFYFCSASIIAFVVYIFTSISSIETQMKIYDLQMQNLTKSSELFFNFHKEQIEIIKNTIQNTELNVKELETILKQRKKQ